MYHRVCERAAARPWFARGTAVTPIAFEQQLDWVTAHFDVVPLRTLLGGQPMDGSDAERRQAALTFDDGYADIVRDVLPRCRARGVVGTVFPVRAHLAGDGQQLWFDALYGILESRLTPAETEADPLIEGIPLSRWVRGPEKESLQHATPQARQSLLRHLADRLGVEFPSGADLYLSEADLRELVGLGWSVGAHGTAHTRLTQLDDLALEEELRRSLEFVRAFDSGEPILAYPDGVHDARVRALVSSTGFRRALTVAPGPVTLRGQFDPLATPRYHCRGDGAVPNQALLEVELPVEAAPVEARPDDDIYDVLR
jgi:peptidoglycan/xylan/chitin deacetylase (PgdA/CDA1 family)